MRIIRVFPRRTSYTPTDDYAFVGDPPLWVPEADAVHISCTFTWDLKEACRLQDSWRSVCERVVLGGPAVVGYKATDFTPGMYVKAGVTFTSRGCNNRCPFCLVPAREGKLRTLPIVPGYIIQDNNFLACSREHRLAVYKMLGQQRRFAVFAGGIDARLVDDEIEAEFRDLRIDSLYLACDSVAGVKPLEKAVAHLSFLPRRKLRCYVLIGYGDETPEQARMRLETIWEVGVLPFAQLYQPADRWIDYSPGWRALQREWARPAAMFANHPQEAPTT
jgi:hypothetical protein